MSFVNESFQENFNINFMRNIKSSLKKIIFFFFSHKKVSKIGLLTDGLSVSKKKKKKKRTYSVNLHLLKNKKKKFPTNIYILSYCSQIFNNQIHFLILFPNFQEVPQ